MADRRGGPLWGPAAGERLIGTIRKPFKLTNPYDYDTSPALEERYRAKLMQRTGEERLMMGAKVWGPRQSLVRSRCGARVPGASVDVFGYTTLTEEGQIILPRRSAASQSRVRKRRSWTKRSTMR